MKPRVIIRTDGDQEIGLGHLIRCIALSHMLKEDFEVIFACKRIPENIQVEVLNSGASIRHIKQDNDIFVILQPSDIVVLDGYSFTESYQKKIKANKNVLVIIDDLHEKEFFADLIINHAPGASIEDYAAQDYTQFALGIHFALLRPSFLAVAAEGEYSKNRERILICFGGADPKNLTEQVLSVIISESSFKKIDVVTGCAATFSKSLVDLIAQHPNVKYYSCLNEVQMIGIMKTADVAVVPSSGILLESLAVGCTVLSGMYVENQRFIYQQFVNEGLIIDAGNFSKYEIIRALKSLSEKSFLPIGPIDGLSGKRILKMFKQLAIQNKISLRDATIDDVELTYEWAIDKAVRRFSFSKHIITKHEHENWFLSKLDDPNCRYYIFLIEAEVAGSIRFDIKEDSAIISYLLDPKFHGKGFGVTLIKEGEKRLQKDKRDLHIQFDTFVGYVEVENVPSVKIFSQLGYQKIASQDTLKFEKKLSYDTIDN